MGREKAKEIAHEFIDALHKLESGSETGVGEIVELFSADARLTNAAIAGRELVGKEGAREFWTEYRKTFGEIHSEFSHVIVDKHAAGLFWRSEGTGVDGRPVAYDGVSLLEWSDDGKIKFFRGYYDTRELGQNLGVEGGVAQARG